MVHVQTKSVEARVSLKNTNIKNLVRTCQQKSLDWIATRTLNTERKPRRNREDKRIAKRIKRERIITTSVYAPS